MSRQRGDSGEAAKRDALGVRAAASPGSDRKRRRNLPSPEKKFGDHMAKNRSPGSIGQREVNLEAGKERKLAHAVGTSLARPAKPYKPEFSKT